MYLNLSVFGAWISALNTMSLVDAVSVLSSRSSAVVPSVIILAVPTAFADPNERL